MSDYERTNVATGPFGQSAGRAGSVAVDQGLRAYMLTIYNYMVLGLAITGLAALGRVDSDQSDAFAFAVDVASDRVAVYDVGAPRGDRRWIRRRRLRRQGKDDYDAERDDGCARWIVQFFL